MLEKKMKARHTHFPQLALGHCSECIGLAPLRAAFPRPARPTRDGPLCISWEGSGQLLGLEDNRCVPQTSCYILTNDGSRLRISSLCPRVPLGPWGAAPANVFYATSAPSMPALQGALSAERRKPIAGRKRPVRAAPSPAVGGLTPRKNAS